MCLEIKRDQKAEIAEEDIIVYKYLIEDDKGQFTTSFQYADVKIGETYTSELIISNNEVYNGLHSYANERNAERQAISYREVLVQCTIPKGSIFYTGEFVGSKSYASNVLRYDHVIKSF